MINRIKKIINNKLSGFLKFIFFLRYLFVIFFVAICLFLVIPQFFDYKKKEKIIKNYLNQNYGIEIIKIENIKFYSFPVPHLQAKNVISNFSTKKIPMEIQKLDIYPKLFSIYNFNKFETRKIKLEKNTIDLNLKNFRTLINNTFSLQKKIYFKDLNISVKDDNNKIIEIKKIDYKNYGYKKNKIIGEIFDEKFKISLESNLSVIDFKLSNTGISAKLKLLENQNPSQLKGELKAKIIHTNIKSDLYYDDVSLEIKNFFFRNKDLSFYSRGRLVFKPFFKIKLNSEIRNINSEIFRSLNIENLLNSKDLIKRLNSQIDINFKTKKFKRDLIDNLEISTILAYGRLNIKKNFSISNSSFKCQSKVNLVEDFPVFYFDCNLNSKDKRKLFKKFKINYKIKNEPLDISIKGNLNILNNVINFDQIYTNSDNNFSNEDLKYFKNSFENIVFDKNFLDIFNVNKIRNFIIEIS